MRCLAIFMALLMSICSVSLAAQDILLETVVHESPTNQTGVDLRVVSVSMEYTNTADQSKYQMFSSNTPPFQFNRPQELYVIDGMLNTSTTLTITVENLGTNPSGVVDVNVLLLHNEYAYFEFVNTTVQMAAISGGATDTASVDIVPSYAGNHTMVARATASVADDNPNNDARTQSFTVGYRYSNCDGTASYYLGNGWQFSTDTSITPSQSCHAGNGMLSSYNNNIVAAMTTPVMDMSDAILNPLRTNGLSMFYTGGAEANDQLTISGRNTAGQWVQYHAITGVIDNDFNDGASWQTFSFADKGHASPLLPITSDMFHSTSQFKFEFSSDASGSDIGYYLDEIVFVYDQKVRKSEYSVSAQGVSTTGSTPGEWGTVTLKIVNTGNITETFFPRLDGAPESWDVYYLRPSGTSFDPAQGLVVQPGSPVQFSIQVQPDVNASTGFQPMVVNITSQQYNEISTELPVQYLVKADRVPVIHPPSVRPSCPPSFVCTFEIELENQGQATDVFDLSVDTTALPNDWSVSLAWSQATSVLIRPSETVQASFIMSVPANEPPDTVVEFDLVMRAQNDTSRVAIQTVPISASMVSNASVYLNNLANDDKLMVDAGSQITVSYTIVNNASRQDIFTMRVLVEGAETWHVHQPTRPDAVLNPGSTTTFEINIDVPENAQSDDRGPTLTPVIESKRSMMSIEGEPFDGLRVKTTNDLRVDLVNAPATLTPGVANEVQLRLTNNGNGDVTALLDVPDIPSTWSWWMTIEGQNVSGGVDLSVSYDLQHQMNVSVWVLLPSMEAAGERHTIAVEVQNQGADVDANPDDNRIEFITRTEAIRLPSASLVSQTTSTMAGGTMMAEAQVRNDGNAVEDSLAVMATVSSTPPVPGLLAFFSIEGADQPMASEVPLMIPAGEFQSLKLEVIVPDDAPLNTRFVLQFEFLGVLDDQDLPREIILQALVLLDQQRQVDSEFGLLGSGPTPHGTAAVVLINQTSTSTVREAMNIAVAGEDGWQISCNKLLVNESGFVVEFLPGQTAPTFHQQRCEILRLSGPISGTLTIATNSEDGTIASTSEIALLFATPPTDSTLSGTTMLATGITGMMVLGGLLFFMKSRRPADEEMEEAMAGPPVSMVSQERPLVQATETTTKVDADDQTSASGSAGPPLPEGGLPPGWTEEQWAYYGQQYLDGTL